MSNQQLIDLEPFARELAQAARRETLPRARQFRLDNKGGNHGFDPVTDADQSAEAVMRSMIESRFPDHGISGEEFGHKPARNPYSWSLDPIDGTRSFMCGLPTWTTLIGLLDEGEPVLGLIDAPRLDETYIGAAERTLLLSASDQRTVQTSKCTNLQTARFSTTDPFLFGPEAEALQPILRSVRVTRFGHDAYAYARLAAGDLDLIVEGGLKPHDYQALIPVVRGAGGHFGNWKGGDDVSSGNVVAAASRELYEAAVALLPSE